MKKKVIDKKTPKLVTEEQFKTELGYLERVLKVEIKFSTLTVRQEMDSNLRDLKNFLLTTFDPLLKELEDRRQDRELGASQTSAIRETVEDHEKRIVQLEHPRP